MRRPAEGEEGSEQISTTAADRLFGERDFGEDGRMTVLRHSVSVASLTPDQLRQLVASACDFAQSTRVRGQEVVLEDGSPVPGVRLVKGHHLRPGARYDIADDGGTGSATVLVRQWQRGEALAVEQLLVSAEGTARTVVRLRAPDHPRLVEVQGRAAGSGWLRRWSGKARLDLAAWWAAAAIAPEDPPAARAPATARLKHPLGQVRLYVRPQRAAGDRWQVNVTVVVHGRWLLRPAAALALMVAGRPVRGVFRSALEQAAADWDRAMGELLALGPDELRTHLARTAAARTEPGTPPDRSPAT